MARDQVEAMAALGFERFAVGGHDPGAFFALHVRDQLGLGEDPARFPPEVLAHYRRGGLPRLYPDVLDVWRPWADDVRGHMIDARHVLAEERPAETADALVAFLGGAAVTPGPGVRSSLAGRQLDRKDTP